MFSPAFSISAGFFLTTQLVIFCCLARDSASAKGGTFSVTVDPAPMGLLYQNPDVPAYEEIRWQRKARPDREAFLQRLDAAMDLHTVS